MANRRKLPKSFGKATGIHKCIRRQKYPGRPINKSSRSNIKVSKRQVSRVHVRKMKRKLQNFRTVDNIFTVCRVSQPDEMSIKLKFSRFRNVSGNGYRIMNLDCLQKHVMEITVHTCFCEKAKSLALMGFSPIKLVSEVRTVGLVSIIEAQCQGCEKTFRFETSPKLNGSNRRYDLNVRAVWGSIATGNGPAHLKEFLGTLDSPSLLQPGFSAIEHEIGEWWRKVLETEMLCAGVEERQMAIDRGDFHGDVPSITVITDGGWSKRTHKHSYNALGGVAIIIGKETKKLLHVGVRNKYCYICNIAESKHEDPKPHTCFKNWSESSQAMESDVIVEGFCQAESKHGLRYMRIIGDGDSSVFARIRDEVPLWGRYVEKLECANHACKCLRSNLEKLAAENPMYKGQHHLSKSTRVRLVSSIRCAIRMRSAEATNTGKRKEAAKKLSHDVRNSVYHVFGRHDNCSDFCKARSTTQCSAFPDIPDKDTDLDVETVTDVLDSQVHLWSEGTSLEAQEESRNGTSVCFQDVESFIIRDVLSVLTPLANKSERLLGNFTTNLAECWMHIRTKFDGGKLYNLCSRGSWHGRCYGGALRMNLGVQWSPKVWKIVTASEPGRYFTQLYKTREQQLGHSTSYKKKPESRKKRWKRKFANIKQERSKRARQSYGPEAIDVTSDVSGCDLENLKKTYLEKNISICVEKIAAIEKATKAQSQSGLWHTERKKRLTASNFGAICRRNPAIKVTPLLRNLLYSTFKGNRHTRNGLLQEQVTIEEYKMKKAEEGTNVNVETMGLVVDMENKFLAGSPDGKVKIIGGETGLIEVKNVLHQEPINLWQAVEKKKNFCLEKRSKTLALKKTHDYYFQCQGLLNICNYDWIDFVVRTVNPYHIHIERIFRDKDLWANSMLPKLKAFYYSSVLPELACPREGKSPGIREPGIWFHDQKVSKRKKVKGIQQHQSALESDEDNYSDNVQPSTSHQQNPNRNTEIKACATRRRRRVTRVKFVGRRISHEWVVDASKNEKDWYRGTVLNVLSGRDGDPDAVYDVLYEGDDESYEIDHLLEDFNSGSLKFIDIYIGNFRVDEKLLQT